MEFEADVKDGKYETVKVKIEGGKIYVNDEEYELKGIKDVKLVEGLGLNKIYINYMGKEVLLVEFTNNKREEMIRFYEILKNGIIPEEVDNKERGEKRGVTKFALSLISPYKWRIVLGVILSFSLVVLSLIPPYLLKTLINGALLGKNFSLLLVVTLTLVGVNVLNIVLSALQNIVLNLNGQRIINELRNRLYKHVMQMSSSFIDRYNTGRILSRLTTDINNTLWFVTWGIPAIITNIGTIIGVGIALFLITPSLGIYALIPMPVIIFGTIGYRRKSKIAYHRLWRRSADISSILTDTIPNIDTIKSYVREDFEEGRLERISKELIDAQMRVIKTNLTWFPIISLTISTVTVIIWFIGGEDVLDSTLQLGTLVAFVTYTSMFYQPVQNLISSVIPFTQQSLTSMERIIEVLNAESDIKENENAKVKEIEGEIEFKHVTFGYEKIRPIVKDFNLRIKKGEKVAIVGRSGSGKSTIIKLLLRLYDPQEGKILIDGVPIKELKLKEYRDQVGLIRAEPTIFYGTVEYNIRYGNLNAKPEEIIAAAMASGAHDFIMEMPFAYDTHLGERGNKISSGQKQMIEIARLFLKRPKLLLLDEATASVDSLSEKQIMERLLTQFEENTIVIIAHRLSTLLYADRIIVMENGRVVEEGTFEELVKKRGKFYEIFESQIPYTETKRVVRRTLSYDDYLKMLKPVNVEVIDKDTIVVNGVKYNNVKFYKPFPITKPYFLLIKTSERYFTVEDYRKIKGTEIVERVLNEYYFIPRIEEIKRIDTTGDEFVWEVKTDKGFTTFKTRGRTSIVRTNGRIFIIDVNDDLYIIEKLNKKSWKILESII